MNKYGLITVNSTGQGQRQKLQTPLAMNWTVLSAKYTNVKCNIIIFYIIFKYYYSNVNIIRIRSSQVYIIDRSSVDGA